MVSKENKTANLQQVVQHALQLWGLENAEVKLAAARENHVFKIESANCKYALRLHRPGYHSDIELRSELQWMSAAHQGGLHVPAPIPSISGDFLVIVCGYQVDLLSWLEGQQLGANRVPLNLKNGPSTFYNLGKEMAKLHQISDSWEAPAEFSRWCWDRHGLLGEQPLWDRFWENPSLSHQQSELLIQVRRKANEELAELEADLDFGLIHADLIRENVILDNQRVQLIDFDDGGYGFRLFDIATALIKNLDEPNYEELKQNLIQGYRSIRNLDDTHLPLFMVLRSLTYVGWIIKRLDANNTQARSQHNIDTALSLSVSYMKS